MALSLGKLDKVVKLFIRGLDVNQMLSEIWQKREIQDYIIALNQDAQLFDQGITSDGSSLGTYSPFTIAKKESEGKFVPADFHIMLFDEGDFYDSFNIRVTSNGFLIVADAIKEDGTDLVQEYGRILGLTDESIQELRAVIQDELKQYIEQKLQEL